MDAFLELHPEVEAALAEERPVVALESTIISHGMPYPRNVETALAVEQVVRENGAVPATVAVLEGKMRAGLSPDEIDLLGKRGGEVAKASRRDLPVLLARKGSGATTVAATMIVALRAGIHVFATGGIGGVHRGATQTMDISADLQELARTSVAVVCAGAKSILNLPLTLEYLETHGVPVIGYRTDEFPAFFTRRSGLPVDHRAENPSEIAAIMHAKWATGLRGGLVIANPIPPNAEPEYAVIEQAIEQALGKAEAQNIKGKALTPFLLAEIEALTGGRSLLANIELVLNNARLAAQVAKAHTRLLRDFP